MRKIAIKLAILACTLLAGVMLSTSPSRAELLAIDDGGKPVQVLGIGTAQMVTYTATNADTSAFVETVGTVVIRVGCTSDCHMICDSATPTATTSHMMLFAGAAEYFKVPAGNLCSFVRDATDGKATVMETN